MCVYLPVSPSLLSHAPGFLKWKVSVHLCVCVYAHPPKVHLKNHSCEMKPKKPVLVFKPGAHLPRATACLVYRDSFVWEICVCIHVCVVCPPPRL